MPNAIEQIYDKLCEVFGGTNPNQIFTMLMPGTSLNASSYAYDTMREKPATVVEAESKLVDQMFDITKVTGGPNGQRVSSQYQQALSVLVPQFNPIMPVLKKTLRDFLNSPVNITGDDGQPIKGTLQEYYFKLYEDWIASKLAWDKQIIDKKTELAKNPDTETELFLEWYEEVAEAELAKIDEKMAKVLGVFAPSDMDAILGALASGPGGEIEEAMNTVKDIRKASPNGGYFLPVDLIPNDWFLDLASDIDPVNLLKDPEFIADTVAAKRSALQASISQIQGILSLMPTQGDIKNAAENLTKAQQSYTDAQNTLVNTYADNTAIAVNMYLARYTGGNAEPADDQAKLTELNNDVTKVATMKKNDQKVASKAGGAPLTKEEVQALVDGQKKVIKAQSDLITTAQSVADAGLNLASAQSAFFGELPVLLARQQAQLAEITAMQNQLSSSIIASDNKKNTIITPPAKAAAKPATASKSETSQRFMELQFSFSVSDMDTKSSSESSFSQTSWGVDLFFGSASGSSTSSSATSASNSLDENTSIQIGLKATKVDIERGWLDPGVFKLTADMGRISSNKISNGNTLDQSDLSKLNGTIFPGFPVSMVIAKDVTIAFKANSTSLDAVHSVVDSRSSVGGGFLCFSASSSSASHSESSAMSTKTQDQLINISMPGPQILGYFVELTPIDLSPVMEYDPSAVKVPTVQITASAKDISIINFVKQLTLLSQQQ